MRKYLQEILELFQQKSRKVIIEIFVLDDSHNIPKDLKNLFDRDHLLNQFYSSRMALYNSVQRYILINPEKDIKLNKLTTHFKTKFKQLEIVNHEYLKHFPDLVVSLSHSKNFGAAVIESKKNAISVGIDIELSSRKFNPSISRHFVNNMDSKESINDTLSLWSKKEAAYKAISPIIKNQLNGKQLVLKDIWIQQNKFGLIDSSKALGTIEFKTERINELELIVTTAYIS